MISKAIFASRASRLMYPIYERTVARTVRKLFFSDLIRHTNYFHNIHWMGDQVFQNVMTCGSPPRQSPRSGRV